MGWLYLFVAIVFEVVGTTYLKKTEGNLFSSAGLLMFVFYIVSFCMLTLAIKHQIEIGVGYAIWSGVGTAMIAVIGVILFAENASLMKFLCISLIIVGVVGLKIDKPSSPEKNNPSESHEPQQKLTKTSELSDRPLSRQTVGT